MQVQVEFCVIPINAGESLSPYIAECQKILDEAGLSCQLHAFGTNIEGEWEVVMAAIKHCHQRIHEMGAARIHTQLKIGSRVDRPQSLQDKVDSVQALQQAQQQQ
ncbi:MTH1187 family thiamine-binding protein [uncultured Spongiibacter sp.]|uniref:MTH1187 family thiamine-binding protein n=1 Tax=Spongiibacter tropicus TaxID=454602 RepID=UPI0025994EB2|nr:MTH1187 family thiamine-binding protein [uncultured Spongiibacter sp.]